MPHLLFCNGDINCMFKYHSSLCLLHMFFLVFLCFASLVKEPSKYFSTQGLFSFGSGSRKFKGQVVFFKNGRKNLSSVFMKSIKPSDLKAIANLFSYRKKMILILYKNNHYIIPYKKNYFFLNIYFSFYLTLYSTNYQECYKKFFY